MLLHKLLEAALLLLSVKLFTNCMGKRVYAEYQLTLAAVLVAGNVLVMPAQQAYLRYQHTVPREQALAGGRFVLRWFTLVTAAVAILAAVVSPGAGRLLEIEKWTILGGGLVFAANRWQMFNVAFRDYSRRRRAAALQNAGGLLAQVVFVALGVTMISRTATCALLSHAAAVGVIAALGTTGFVRAAWRHKDGTPRALVTMIRTFGVPYALLMLCQWTQGFSERFILGYRLNLAVVGVYIAAFQVCGFPYLLMGRILRAWLVPVAYQRAGDGSDRERLRVADQILVRGAALYLLAGALLVPAYWWVGPWLLRVMTAPGFVLSADTLVLLALARYVQHVAPLFEACFEVHQRMHRSLSFRAIGALLVVPVCWATIGWLGVAGAALGVFLATSGYLLLLTFGPGGWMSMTVRSP